MTCKAPAFTNKLSFTLDFSATDPVGIVAEYLKSNEGLFSTWYATQPAPGIPSVSRSIPVTVTKEGTYTFQCSANNGTNTTLNIPVVVDTTPPIVTNVALDSLSGTWFNPGSSISATAADLGVAPSGVAFLHAVVTSDKGYSSEVTQMGTSLSWTPAGLTDGNYTVTVTATDRAGNESEPVIKSFQVDVTAPTVSIDGPANGSVIGKTADLVVTATDDMSGMMRYYVTATCTGGTVKGLPTSVYAAADGAVVLSGPWPTGTCTVRLDARDNANNASSTSVKFTVNADAPGFSCSAAPSEAGSGDDVTVALSDINATAKASYSLSVTGPAPGNTAVSELSDERPMSDDTSDLTKSLSATSLALGTYSVTCSVRDEYGNAASSTATFAVVDNTAPVPITAKVWDPATAKCGDTSTTAWVTATPATGYPFVALYEAGETGQAPYREVRGLSDASSGSVTWDVPGIALGSTHTWVVVGSVSGNAGSEDWSTAVSTVATAPDAATGCTMPVPPDPDPGQEPAPGGQTPPPTPSMQEPIPATDGTPAPLPADTVPATGEPSSPSPDLGATAPEGTSSGPEAGAAQATGESMLPISVGAAEPGRTRTKASHGGAGAAALSEVASTNLTLPYTGSDSGIFAAIAATAVALGSLLLIAARRFRQQDGA